MEVGYRADFNLAPAGHHSADGDELHASAWSLKFRQKWGSAQATTHKAYKSGSQC